MALKHRRSRKQAQKQAKGDAKLAALEKELETAIKEWRKTFDRYNAVESARLAEQNRALAALTPDNPLCLTSADLMTFDRVTLYAEGCHRTLAAGGHAHLYIRPAQLPALRERLEAQQKRRPKVRICSYIAKRVPEILKAGAKHFAAVERLAARERVLDDAHGEILRKTHEIARRVLKHDARTIDGVLTKLRAISWIKWGEENPSVFADQNYRPLVGGDEDDEAIVAIGRDLNRIAKAA